MEEMTEASDRIHQEVGDSAEIIWGQTIDETMGDEMRVTVIATGIGSDNFSNSKESHAKPIARFNPPVESTLRGKVRDLTADDIQHAAIFDEPTFIRQTEKRVGNDSRGSSYRGYKGIVIDNDDLDVPTFLRRKAD